MKYEPRPYSPMVEKKLEQLPGVDADHLWNGMHAILDKKMPQKRERRRFIAWFLTDKGLFLLGIALLLTATGFSLFFLSPGKTFSIDNHSTTKISNSAIQHSTTDNTSAINVQSKKETIAANLNQNDLEQLSASRSNDAIDNGVRADISSSVSVSSNNRTNNKNFQSIPAESIGDAHQTMQETDVERNAVNIDPIYGNESYITSDDFKPLTRVLTNNAPEQKSIVEQATATQKSAPAHNIKVRREKGLYAGIVSGVDLSSVHFQSIRTGASQGLILGYAVNNRWSFESGLLWDKKRYYDDGRYFDPPGYAPTSGVQIVAVNGTNRIYEWPINARYTVISGKHSLFATAGLSSYIMKSEHYDYEYVQNNQPGGHNYISYNNATKNWFSVLNLSLGYSHKLGSVGSLRVEPYLKIPVKNLGIANMPVMSTGLNIGFTRPLTR